VTRGWYDYQVVSKTEGIDTRDVDFHSQRNAFVCKDDPLSTEMPREYLFPLEIFSTRLPNGAEFFLPAQVAKTLCGMRLTCCALACFLFARCVAIGDQDADQGCLNTVRSRTVSFEADVKQVLQKQCTRCHDDMATAASYRARYYPAKTTVRINLPMTDPKYMPPGISMSRCEILILEKWETDGFAN
jgi:hypothetical protein